MGWEAKTRRGVVLGWILFLSFKMSEAIFEKKLKK